MPSKERHEAQAQHNQRVLAALPADALDWRITMMMYTALHGVHAYLCTQDNVHQHAEYNYGSYGPLLQKYKQFELAADYKRLVSLSQDARYKCVTADLLEKKHMLAVKLYQATVSRLSALGVSLLVSEPQD